MRGGKDGGRERGGDGRKNVTTVRPLTFIMGFLPTFVHYFCTATFSSGAPRNGYKCCTKDLLVPSQEPKKNAEPIWTRHVNQSADTTRSLAIRVIFAVTDKFRSTLKTFKSSFCGKRIVEEEEEEM